jgi:hypothetical protein
MDETSTPNRYYLMMTYEETPVRPELDNDSLPSIIPTW